MLKKFAVLRIVVKFAQKSHKKMKKIFTLAVALFVMGSAIAQDAPKAEKKKAPKKEAKASDKMEAKKDEKKK